MDALKDLLYKQLALDYCCSVDEVMNRENQFHVYKPLEGRRRFRQADQSFLRVAAFRNKLLFAGDPRMMEWCREKYANADGAWFMEPDVMRELDGRLAEYGYGLDFMHPYYVSCKPSSPDEIPGKPVTSRGAQEENAYEIRYYRGCEIEAFRGDPRFGNAFTFLEAAPDEIGVAAIRNGEILGMAGVSHDSPYLWQIGIDVLPEARGKGIGVTLVRLIRDEILAEGKLPYYGTAFSHTISQNIAIRAGFTAAWTELTADKLEK